MSHNRKGLGLEKPKNTKQTIKRLFTYLKPYQTWIIISTVLTVLATIAQLYGSYAVSPILNLIQAAVTKEITIELMSSQMMIQLAILAVVYFVEIAAVLIAAQLMLRVSEKSMHTMREELFSHLMVADIGYHDSQQYGDLMSRFTNDIGNLSETLGDTTRTFISNILSLIGTFVVMLVLSPLLTLIVVVFFPLLIFVIQFIGKKTRKASRERQASLGALNGYIEESIEGVTVNQLFVREDQSQKEFHSFNKDFSIKSHTSQSLGFMMMPLMQNFNMIIYAFVGILGGYLAINTGLSVGDLGAFVNMTRSFGRPLNMIANQFSSINSALSAAERIFDVLDKPVESINSSDVELHDIQGKVVFDSVDFSYVENKPILNDVSFYAKTNQKIAIVGSTGAGKTTITNLITRFYDINEGSILVDDIDIKNINRYSLRENIGMVLQDTHLFTGTIMENIRYGRLDATDEECIAAAKLANADYFIRNLEFGYDTEIRGDGEGLSQGQRQLLNIARAAVANPKILILDEATSSIDTRTEELVEEGMDKLMEGRTTFVIAHRLSTVRNANAIIVLENGQIIEKGNHDDLVALGGRYASLYKNQSELIPQ